MIFSLLYTAVANMPIFEQKQAQSATFVEELSDRIIAVRHLKKRVDFQVQGYLIRCVWSDADPIINPEGGLEVFIPGADVYFCWQTDDDAMASMTTRKWRHGGHGDLGSPWLADVDLEEGLIRR